MPHNLFRQTPAEAMREMYERDVEVARHLLYRENESFEESDVSEEAAWLAETLVDGIYNIPLSPEKLVLDLYALDESKQHHLELLQGV